VNVIFPVASTGESVVKKLAFLVLLFATSARAQITYAPVTATVTDPAGYPYANAFYVISLEDRFRNPDSSATTPDGSPFSAMPINGQMDAARHFSVNLVADVNTVSLSNISDASNFSPGMYASFYTKMPAWSSSTTYSTGQMASTAGIIATAGASIRRPIGLNLLSSTREPVNNTWHFVSGVGEQVNGNAFTLPGYTVNTMTPQSGTVVLYTGYLAAQTVLVIPMSGNIIGINFGNSRTQGLESYLVFQQPASGGPYSLTSTFCSRSAPVLDCPNGVPALHTAANSYTFVRIMDDGKTIHMLSSNNPTTGGLGDWTNTGAGVGKVPVCQTVVGGVCTSWAPGNAVTSTSGLSDWSNASASVNYVATCKATSLGSCTSWRPAAGGVGGPVLVRSIDLTGQTADKVKTVAFTTPAAVGSYLVTCYTVVTTVATTSSTLPNCFIGFVDGDTGINAINSSGAGNTALGSASRRNVVGAISYNTNPGNAIYIHTAASSIISYGSEGYASSGATSMAYALHLRIEYLGP
jgi:hypothetical protein